MNTAIITTTSHSGGSIIPADATGHQLYRLRQFEQWLQATGGNPLEPNLKAYRDYLLSEHQVTEYRRGEKGSKKTVVKTVPPLTAASVKAHLSTIRARYKAVIDDPETMPAIYAMMPPGLSPADRKAKKDDMLEQLEKHIKPGQSKVEIGSKTDVKDSEHLRLSEAEAAALMAAPVKHKDNIGKPLVQLRDTAIIAMMLCTGLRESELCNLNVEDLRQKTKGALAVEVKRGKGAKQRMVPYGQLVWVLGIVEKWLNAAGIESGPVFRGFWKESTMVRSTRLTRRAINQVMDKYKIEIQTEDTDGNVTFEMRSVNPHDCRRTYARRLYDSGMDMIDIRDNLGHASRKTTEIYIGAGTVETRKPKDIYQRPDLSGITLL